MKKQIGNLALIAVGVVAMVSPALAHPGHGAHGGFLQGVAHPIGGWDHVLAMVGVGLLAAQLGGRAIWLVPAAFVVMMVAGGLLGFSGVGVPHVELGIAASVVVVGLMVASGWKLPIAAVMAVIGGFAVFHGYAHGIELPVGAEAASFVGGFVLATGLLHGMGIALGQALHIVFNSIDGKVWPARAIGTAMALTGVFLIS